MMAALCAFGVILTLTGCSIWPRKPASDNIILGRQHSLRGMAALREENYQQAERWFADAVAQNPNDERAWAHYADLLWRRGKRSEGLANMQKAAQLSGGAADYEVRVGEMHFQLGETEVAARHAVSAIQSDMNSADAWALQGDCLRTQGDLQTALARYHRALSLREHFPRVQLAVAEVYNDLRRPQRAAATLAALIDSYPPGQAPQYVLVKQAVSLKDVGRMDRAVEVLELARQSGPSSPQLLYQLAEAQYLAGDSSHARVTLEESLSADANHEASRRLLADLNSQMRARDVQLR